MYILMLSFILSVILCCLPLWLRSLPSVFSRGEEGKRKDSRWKSLRHQSWDWNRLNAYSNEFIINHHKSTYSEWGKPRQARNAPISATYIYIYVCRMYTLYIVYSAPFCSIVIYGDPQYFMVLHRTPLCSTILHRPSTAPISTGTILRSPCLRSVKYQTAAAAYIRLTCQIMSYCDFL